MLYLQINYRFKKLKIYLNQSFFSYFETLSLMANCENRYLYIIRQSKIMNISTVFKVFITKINKIVIYD